jgi:hypothetical protein
LETEAAAANSAAKAGKMDTVTISATRPVVVPAEAKASTKGSSTIAAVAAAHSELKADVKGRIAADLAPWLAYVSHTAALRALRATASVARLRVLSERAKK